MSKIGDVVRHMFQLLFVALAGVGLNDLSLPRAPSEEVDGFVSITNKEVRIDTDDRVLSTARSNSPSTEVGLQPITVGDTRAS